MPANINFTQLEDPLIAWATKDALNSWFSGITVSDATNLNAGVVKQAANVAAPAVAQYAAIQTQDETGQLTNVQVPSKASFDALQTLVGNLLVALKNAGSMVKDA